MSTTAPTPPGPRDGGPARYHPRPGAYDEMLDPSGAARPALDAAGRRVRRPRHRRAAAPPRAGRPPARPGRRRLQRLRRAAGPARAAAHGAALAAGPDADRGLERRVGGHRDRRDRAGRAAQPGARGSLRAAHAAAPAAAAARGRVQPRRLPARVRRDPPAHRPAAVRLCGRPRARRRGTLAGAVRPRAGAVRVRLRAREPRGHLARVPEPVPRRARPSPGAVPALAARGAAGGRAARDRRPADRGAHAGAVERDGVRARLPCVAPGVPARRGVRPHRARRRRCACARSASSSRCTSSCAASTRATAIRSS